MKSKPQIDALKVLKDQYVKTLEEAMQSLAENQEKLRNTPADLKPIREGLIRSTEIEIHDLAHSIDVIDKVIERQEKDPADDVTEHFSRQADMYSQAENDNVHMQEISLAIAENSPRQLSLKAASNEEQALIKPTGEETVISEAPLSSENGRTEEYSDKKDPLHNDKSMLDKSKMPNSEKDHPEKEAFHNDKTVPDKSKMAISEKALPEKEAFHNDRLTANFREKLDKVRQQTDKEGPTEENEKIIKPGLGV